MATIDERLAAIRKNLDALVGVEKVVAMTPEKFLKYAIDQVTKAAGEPSAKCMARLKHLQKNVTVAKDNYIDDASESIKVPVFVDEQTTLKEQSNEMSTPEKSAALNRGGQSIFEDGMVAKSLESLVKALEAMKADDESGADDEEKSKSKKAGDDEDEDEEKKAKKAKGDDEEEEPEEKKKADDVEEDDDTTKGKKKKAEEDAGDGGAAEDEQGKSKAKKRSLAKNIPGGATDADGTFWPNDMNEPTFVKKGAAPEAAWGKDPTDD